jgi:oligo-1,6-glucosidase/alpha-glucosidase
MLDVVRYWLREGADGLRLDIFNTIFKDRSFDDNPFSWRPVPSHDNPHGFFQRYRHTVDHPDTLAFARELRSLVDEFRNPPRFLVGEVFGAPHALRRYCGDAADGLHLVFLFKTMKAKFSGRAVRRLITEIEASFPEPFTPTYVFGNHDRPRFVQRFRGELNSHPKAKLFATLQLTVRGVPFIYYGEEIGMENHDMPLHEGLDPVAKRFVVVPNWAVKLLRRHGVLLNRDESRSPMQWQAGPNAGFTEASSRPWLPLHPNSERVNVAVQRLEPRSLFHCYKKLLRLRRALVPLQAGTLEWITGLPDDIVAYRRNFGDGSVSVFLNFGRRVFPVRLADHDHLNLFSSLTVEQTRASESYLLQRYEGIVVWPLTEAAAHAEFSAPCSQSMPVSG